MINKSPFSLFGKTLPFHGKVMGSNPIMGKLYYHESMLFFDPLEQFIIEFDYNYWLLNPQSNLSATVLLVLILLVLIISKSNSSPVLLTDKLYKWHETGFYFVADLLKNIVKVSKPSFIIILYTLFIYIFLSNILGMVPGMITITSHFMFTLFLSLTFFISNNLIGMYYHREKYFVLFLPDGVPVVIIPFLILIEYVSYLSRVLSLAIRLFANMMSGHILMKILVGFIWAFLSSGIMESILSIAPLLVVFAVVGLETCIAFLQAYVFVVLIAIYLNDIINTH